MRKKCKRISLFDGNPEIKEINEHENLKGGRNHMGLQF